MLLVNIHRSGGELNGCWLIYTGQGELVIADLYTGQGKLDVAGLYSKPVRGSWMLLVFILSSGGWLVTDQESGCGMAA